MSTACARRLAVIALWCCLLWAAAAGAADIPQLTGRVVDTANVLSPPARSRIESTLAAHENRTSNQVVVLTVPGFGDATIEQYAQRVFESWKLGIKGRDNGVLLVIAPRERALRIHVGFGLEGPLPDAYASRIIHEVIVPRLKAGNFDAALEEGVKAVIARLDGAPPLAVPAAAPSGPGFFYYAFWLVALLVLGAYTYYKVTSPKGWLAYVLLAPLWWIMPAVFLGPANAVAALAVFLAGYPAAKLLVRRTDWYKRMVRRRARLQFRGGSGGGGSSSAGAAAGWSSSSDSSYSSGSGDSGGSSYSGGGGDSGGGGASGRW